MTTQTKNILKSYFNAGDIPTEVQFADLIDTTDGLGWINVKDYGAIGNGIADDTIAINNAIAVAAQKTLYFPPGTYLVSSPIVLLYQHKVFAYMATLKASAPMAYLLGATAGYAIQVGDIILDANNLATYGLYLPNISIPSEIGRVSVHNAVSHGIFGYRSMCMSLRDVYSYNNGGSGFYLEGCNASNYYNIRGVGNTLDGITILSSVGYASDCGLYGGSAESNGRHQLYVYNCSNPVLILGLHAETSDSNIDDPVLLEESVGAMIGGRISGYGIGSNYCIHLTGATRSAWYVVGNKLARNGVSNASIAQVKDDASFPSTIEDQISSSATMQRRHNSGASASIADGGTITHGLSSTPIRVIATPSIASEMVSVTVLGATTFTVAIKKHDGTAGTTQTIYWRAEL